MSAPSPPTVVAPPGGPNRTLAIVMLAGVLGLSAADTGAIGSLAAPLERSFHIGNTRLGLLVTVATLLAAVATLPFGALADRANRTRLLQLAMLTWALATVVSALSVSYAMLLATRAVLGILVAAAGPLVVSLAGDIFPPNERGRLFGLVLSGELIGGGFGIVVAGTLSGLAGWRPALAVLAVPALVLTMAVHRYLPEPSRGAAPADDAQGEDPALESSVYAQAAAAGTSPPKGLDQVRPIPAATWPAVRLILRFRTNVVLIVASGLGYFFLQGLQTFAELFFRDRYGVGQSLASILFIFIAVSAIAGVLVGGRLADRLLRHGHTNARIAIPAVAFAIAPLFLAPGLKSTSLAVSLPLFIVAGMAIGAVNPPIDAARLDIMPPALWGRAEAVRTTLRSLMQGAAPVTFGLVSGVFGPSDSGFGAGVDTSTTATSQAAGHGLALTFLVLSGPLLLAGATLAADRHRYGRDVVAAHLLREGGRPTRRSPSQS